MFKAYIGCDKSNSWEIMSDMTRTHKCVDMCYVAIGWKLVDDQ